MRRALVVLALLLLGACGADEAEPSSEPSGPVEDLLPRAETTTTTTAPATTVATTAAPTTRATAAPTTKATAAPTTAAPVTEPPTTAPTSTYYANCAAARAAGAAPVYRGDPGYGSHLDRDGDGVGCE